MSNTSKIITTKLFPEFLFNSERKILFNRINDMQIKIFVKKGGRTKPLIVNKEIKIDGNLSELFGLWFGDGFKTIGGDKRIFGFTNTEFSLVKRFLKLCKKCLGLDKRYFRIELLIPVKLNQFAERIKIEISKTLNISEEQISRIEFEDGINFVCIRVINTSRLLGILVNSIWDMLKPKIIEDESFCIGILRGIIASEGCVVIRENKLETITIGAKEKSERNFIRNLLLKLDVFPNKDSENKNEAININGLSNFIKIKNLGLLSLNPTKLKKFEEGLRGFEKIEFRKGEGRLFILKILQSGPKNIEELSNSLKRSKRGIKEIDLPILIKAGLVKRNFEGKNIISWEVTEKGLMILKVKEPLIFLRQKDLFTRVKLEKFKDKLIKASSNNSYGRKLA